MLHHIDTGVIGPRGATMADAIGRCVHCGFCLPACPTYRVLGEEMDSPRGRIVLMKEVLEGRIDEREAAPFLDRCLGCLACVPACPSGVDYGGLITSYRARASAASGGLGRRLVRSLALASLPYARRFRSALRVGGAVRRVPALVPRSIRHMLSLVPDRVPASTAWPGVVPATPPARARVALVTGCVQDVLASSITRAAVDLLTANGVEVVMPPAQGCCGALAAHAGDMNRALGLARSLIDAFVPYLETVDAVVTTAAGCGSGIREYGLWFGEADSASRAGLLSQRTVDVSAFLARLGPLAPMRLASPARVAYQDACHLAHAQSVRREPRDLLARIEGLELVELVDGDICCGSAGIYNLEQPDIARTLGARKAATVVATQASVVVTGNVGCQMQLRAHLRESGSPVEVLHTVELLARALETRPSRGA